MLELAAQQGRPLDSLRHALVSGEALPPRLRAQLDRHGVQALQCYGTADVGLIAYETAARDGLAVDEDVIVEIVRPGTGEALPDGEVGEVLVTPLNADHPLLRLATGDLSARLPGPCPSGRTAMRLRGWLGRADQSTKVRGMFVHPVHLGDLLRRHPALLRARLLVRRDASGDDLLLRAESAAANDDVRAQVAQTWRDLSRLRARVELLPPGSLPDDGRLIEDQRRDE